MIYGRRRAAGPTGGLVRIRGADPYADAAGPLGDVDGDGRGDVLVSTSHQPWISVVLGRRSRAPIHLGGTAAGVWRIAVVPGTVVGSPQAAGDVDGDGIEDFAVPSSPGFEEPTDTTYVVLGARTQPVRSLGALGAHGFAIR